jgi:succinate dehydrogenase / fumarate reductase cytochrome b subunit
MSVLRDLYGSTLGKKAVMAVSGIVLFGFVLAHLAGNLKLYLGAEAMNHYAAWLRELGAPLLPESAALWILRGALLVAVIAHVVSATQLTLLQRRARPVAYATRAWVQADYASRTMRWGGIIILLFVIYHLLHLTWGTAHPAFMHPRSAPDGTVSYFAYENVVSGFRVWWVSAFYLVAQLCLGLHLYHGLWSTFQTLGAPRDSESPWRRRFAGVFAALVTLGNLSFPIAVLGGWVR